MGLNLSNEQIGHKLNLDPDDAQKLATQLRQGLVESKPAGILNDEVECDEIYFYCIGLMETEGSMSFAATEGRPSVAQGETLGEKVHRGKQAPEVRKSRRHRSRLSPLQGFWSFCPPDSQGFTLGY